MKRVGMEGSIAVAEAVKLARVDVISSYPITPQTHMPEKLAEIVAEGELDAEYIPVESEHSALSACLGASAVGARTFTATAGQGLELMHEVLFVASGMRLPIVMVVANRALSAPLSVWGDHSDVMAARDCGWIQMFATNAQEAHDLTLCAYRISEDPLVLFPVMVHIDGFHLSHVVEPLTLVEQENVDKFLPPFRYPYALNPDRPLTMGAFAMPAWYSEAKVSMDVALRATKKTIIKVWQEFGELSGRNYLPIETYKADDAETLLFLIGSFSETATTAVNALRAQGQKVGLVSLRLWRPFPYTELRRALASCSLLITFDRAINPGGSAPVSSEIQSAIYSETHRPRVLSYVGGLGGRDVSVNDFVNMIKDAISKSSDGKIDEFATIGIRG